MKKIIVGLVLATLVFAYVNFPRKNDLLPTEMIGTWLTDDTRYAGRFLRLSKTTAIFGVGENEIDVYFIAETKTVILGEEEVIELSLHRPGEDDIVLSLVYENEEAEYLRMLNQKRVVWHRVDEDELVLF